MRYLILILLLTGCATDRQSINDLSCMEAHFYFLGKSGLQMSPQAIEAIAKACRERLR